MALTDAQYTALAAHIRANTDPDVVAALGIRNDTELARLYNLDSAFWVWRMTMTRADLRMAFDWAEVVGGLSATDWQAWAELTADGSIDPSDENIRAGFAEIFKGGTLATTRNALLAAAKRFASVYEEVFATGTGTENTPGTLPVNRPVTISIIGKALNEF